jgi:soluble lytic murein transglycosylase-like protein
LLTRTDHQIERNSPTPRLVLRGGVLLGAAVLVCALAGWPRRAGAADAAPSPTADFVSREIRDMSRRLEAATGESDMLRLQLDRANAVQEYSAKYRIPADLSAAIYDIALSERIQPALAFRLVQVESEFKQRARSEKDAIGLTQLRLATARFYAPGITATELEQRDVNLRIGFHFLRDLLNQFDNNIDYALLAYNRGPTTVANILAQGGNPANGYARKVLGGDPRASQLTVSVD